MIGSNIFLVESSELYILSHHLNQQQFYFFPIQMHFIHFSIVESKSSSTMLNRHGETGHFCLFLDLRGEDFSFSPLWCSPGVCYKWPLFCWGIFLLYQSCLEFLSWKDVEFCYVFFLHLFRWPCHLMSLTKWHLIC